MSVFAAEFLKIWFLCDKCYKYQCSSLLAVAIDIDLYVVDDSFD